MNGAWNSLDEKRKDRDYAENEKYYQEIHKYQEKQELQKLIDRFVVDKSSINIEEFDDNFADLLLAHVDDIDNVNENGRSRYTDVETLDIDSKINHRKHAMLLANNNNSLQIALIDGLNNKYSHLTIAQRNDRMVVDVNTYENGELYRYTYTAKDGKIGLSFGDKFSQDSFKSMLGTSPNSPSVKKAFLYLENDQSTIETHGVRFDKSEFINFDNALTCAAILFNNGIKKYITSKIAANGEQYLAFDDSLIENDFLDLYEQQKESNR